MNFRRSQPPMITLRVSEEDREALKKRANDSGMFLEEYCRSVLLGKRHSIPPKKVRRFKAPAALAEKG